MFFNEYIDALLKLSLCIEQLGERLENRLNNDAAITAIDALALIRDRIQQRGEAPDGSLIGGGQYSTNGFVAIEEDFRSNALFRRAAGGADSVYLEGGYEELRKINNLVVDKVNLSFQFPKDNSLWRDVSIQLQRVSRNEYIIFIGTTNFDNKKKLINLEQLYGFKILSLSPQEKDLFDIEVNELVKECFVEAGFIIQ